MLRSTFHINRISGPTYQILTEHKCDSCNYKDTIRAQIQWDPTVRGLTILPRDSYDCPKCTSPTEDTPLIWKASLAMNRI